MAIYCTRAVRRGLSIHYQLGGLRISGVRYTWIRAGSNRYTLDGYGALAYRQSDRKLYCISGTAGTTIDQVDLSTGDRRNLTVFDFTTTQWGSTTHFSMASVDGPGSGANSDILYAMGQRGNRYPLFRLVEEAPGPGQPLRWVARQIGNYNTRLTLCAGPGGALWALSQSRTSNRCFIYEVNQTTGARTLRHTLEQGLTGGIITGACFEDGKLFVAYNRDIGARSYSTVFDADRGLNILQPPHSITLVRQLNGYFGLTSTDRPPAAMASAPGNFRAVVSANTLILSWGTVRGASGYQIRYRAGGHPATYSTRTLTGTNTTLTGLTYNTTYFLGVRARVSGSWSDWTNTTARIGSNIPAVPTGLQVTVSGNTARVFWRPVTGATNYTLRYRYGTQSYTIVTASGSSHNLSNLRYGTQYNVQLRANGPGGSSAYAVTNFTTGAVALGEPRHLTSSVTQLAIALAWTQGNNAQSAEIRWAKQGGRWSQPIAVAGTSYTLRVTEYSTTYLVQARSVRGNDRSAWVSFTPSPQTPLQGVLPPAAPSLNPPTYNAVDRSVGLLWSSVTGATRYSVRYRRQPRGNYTIRHTSGTSMSIENLDAGTWDFQVRASNSGGNSPWSNIVSQVVPERAAVAVAIKAPNAVTGLSVSVNDNEASLSWTFSAVDSTHDAATSYSIDYLRTDETEGPNPRISGITSNTFTLENLAFSSTYTATVRAHNYGGVSDPRTVTINISAEPPDESKFYIYVERNDEAVDIWPRTLRCQARWGRTEVGYLARCLPMQMQITVDNSDGYLDAANLRPRSEVAWGYQREGRGWNIAHGFIESIRPSVDNATGLHTAIIHCEGALAQLVNADHELSLFISESVRIHEVIESALDQAGWPPERQVIDHAQVRINPAHYTKLLSSRSLHRAGPIIRGAEEAEVGFVHEGRGEKVIFEHRFHRELQVQPAAAYATFGTGGTPVEGTVEANGYWDNVWTVVRIGMQSALVQTAGRVYREAGDALATRPIILPANSTRYIRCDLSVPENRDHDDVASVVQWSDPVAEHFTVERVSNSAAITPLFTEGNTGVRIVLSERTRETTLATLVNNEAYDVQITKFELYGRGILLVGGLTLPEQVRNTEEYGRRVLDLPINLIGDGLNEGGDAIAEGQAMARMLLLRYSTPRVVGRLPFNPLANLDTFLRLNVSDPVLTVDVEGIPSPGIYYCEGMDITWDCQKEAGNAVAYISERGRHTSNRNAAVTYTAAGTTWTDITPAYQIAQGQFVAGVEVMFANDTNPSTSDDPVLRLVRGTEVIASWSELDIPRGEADTLAALVEGPSTGNAQIKFQGRRRTSSSAQVVASHYQIVTLGY